MLVPRELPFREQLSELQRIGGPRQPDVPENPTQQQLLDGERQLTDDTYVETFSEQFRVNELQSRRNALQREAAMRDPKQAASVDRAELITVDQSVTYHEYFPDIVRDTIEIMQRYASLRRTMNGMPVGLQIKEEQAKLYLEELNKALRERVAFANVLLAARRIAGGQNVLEATELRKTYMQSPNLSETSRKALNGADGDIWKQGNMLNQRIIDMLAGKTAIPGVDRGFLPQMLYIDLLKEKYRELLDEEKRIVRDPSLQRAQARVKELELRGKAQPTLFDNRTPETQPLTEAEVAEYERLQLQLADRDGYRERLQTGRKEVIQEILSFTDRLALDQMDRAELTTIQHQFGDRFDFDGVSSPNPDRTPVGIRRGMAENMEERSEFHLQRMDAFMERIKGDVLDAGISEWVEDLSNKKGREAMRHANNALSGLVTRLIPEAFGMRDAAYDSLTEPLNQALGWPVGKETWEELTPEEQQNVLKKSQSVLDAINTFDRTTIDNMRTTIALVRSMPDATQFQGQEVREPLPIQRVTLENRDMLMEQYGGATVYMMLFRQMDGDWGVQNPPSGFLGEYAKFLGNVNENVGVHIDVGDALLQLGNTYNNLRKYLFYIALLALGAGAVGGVALYKFGRGATRLTWNTMRGGTRWTLRGMREGGKIVAETGSRLKNLVRNIPKRTPPPAGPAAGTASQRTAAEKVVEGTSRASKIGRVLGPIGIVLVGADLRRVMMRDARLGPLKEYDGIQAAIEFMQNEQVVDTSAPRYRRELMYLERRQDCFLMQQNALQILWAIEKAKKTLPANKLGQAEALQARCTEVEKYARRQKMEFEKLFPITEYLVTDPNRQEGNVGVDIRGIDQARVLGAKYEGQKRLLEEFEIEPTLKRGELQFDVPAKLDAQKGRKRDLEHYDELQEEHRYLLEDAAEFLDTLPS